MAADLLFREAPLQGEEIVRRINGNWLKLRTPPDFVLPDLADGIAELSVEADQVVLLSPLAARIVTCWVRDSPHAAPVDPSSSRTPTRLPAARYSPLDALSAASRTISTDWTKYR